MTYTIKSVQEQFSLVQEDIEKYIHQNKIKVDKDGKLSQKSYQTLFDFFSTEEPTEKHDEIYVLNGTRVKVTQKPFFESDNNRVSIFQNDATLFLKSLPDNSVDVIITDPAYSGMNQKLKLGSGKIIGKYSDAGKDGAKWFEEFHDTEENYKAFFTRMFSCPKER